MPAEADFRTPNKALSKIQRLLMIGDLVNLKKIDNFFDRRNQPSADKLPGCIDVKIPIANCRSLASCSRNEFDTLADMKPGSVLTAAIWTLPRPILSSSTQTRYHEPSK